MLPGSKVQGSNVARIKSSGIKKTVKHEGLNSVLHDLVMQLLGQVCDLKKFSTILK
jgi:hypothetical protein